MTQYYMPTGSVSDNPSSLHWNSENKGPMKYYIRCEAKCDLQIMNFCTCITGRCLMEEVEEKFAGMDSRVIIDMGKEL